ncbi:UNVERIFIED_CONTAM: ATP phosphoribosyltransferase 1, chloroplastic [Sesamum radiatum]|uniref:ATP phosphoribosyltransferase 1, chloroplastic n=1 Tax=Sesamum radiatum TaxID=300843 RepID=A0AAW2VNQ1_SESRA
MKFSVSCCLVTFPVIVVNGNMNKKPLERNEVRLGLPSKDRMSTDTLDLLKDCQLSVRQVIDGSMWQKVLRQEQRINLR